SAWEGMPNVVLEAMAAGRPIVATACEGVAELLGDAAMDQIVASNDGPGFITAIERFALDRSLAERIGSSNRQIAARFSWDATAHGYQTLYQTLIE
ncbi:MAG: glycosyltransferase, partial [Pirellulales bacterium]|nr:glycosyltransferase [Pirellulales bacterium]